MKGLWGKGITPIAKGNQPQHGRQRESHGPNAGCSCRAVSVGVRVCVCVCIRVRVWFCVWLGRIGTKQHANLSHECHHRNSNSNTNKRHTHFKTSTTAVVFAFDGPRYDMGFFCCLTTYFQSLAPGPNRPKRNFSLPYAKKASSDE